MKRYYVFKTIFENMPTVGLGTFTDVHIHCPIALPFASLTCSGICITFLSIIKTYFRPSSHMWALILMRPLKTYPRYCSSFRKLIILFVVIAYNSICRLGARGYCLTQRQRQWSYSPDWSGKFNPLTSTVRWKELARHMHYAFSSLPICLFKS